MTQIASLPSLPGPAGVVPSATSSGAPDGSNFASVLSVAQAGAPAPQQAPAAASPQAPGENPSPGAGASQSPGFPARADAQAQGAGASSPQSGGGGTQAASAGPGGSRQTASSSQAQAASSSGPGSQSKAAAGTGSEQASSSPSAGGHGQAADARHAAADAAGQAGAAAQAAAQAILAQWAALTGQGGSTPDGGKAGAQAGGKTLPPGTQLARSVQSLPDGQALAKAVSDSGAQALQADARAEQAALSSDAHGAQAGFEQVASAAVAAAARSAPSALAALPGLGPAGGVDAGAAATATPGTPARADGAQAPAAALAALNAAGQLGTAIQTPASGVEAAATYSAALPSPVGSAPWGQELGQQMLMAVDGKLQTATLHLNPPQLGPLEVQLQMQGGQVNAQFASPHQAVRQAVESALPQLQDMFAGAGIQLGQASVGTGSPREGGHGGARSRSMSGRGESALDAVPATALAQASPGWLRGLVNTYV